MLHFVSSIVQLLGIKHVNSSSTEKEEDLIEIIGAQKVLGKSVLHFVVGRIALYPYENHHGERGPGEPGTPSLISVAQ